MAPNSIRSRPLGISIPAWRAHLTMVVIEPMP
jgi:hypothetical protein